MEESGIHHDGAPPDANAPNDDSTVSLSSIFQVGNPNKKVIVLQSPGIENDNAIQVQGELPNLMDAVNPPGDGAPDADQSIQLANEITYVANNQSAESVETVSAIEDSHHVLDDSANEVSNMEVSEYASQEISEQNVPEGQELIYIQPEDIKDQEVQYIDVSASNETVTAYQGNLPTDAVAQAFQDAVGDTELPVKQDLTPIQVNPPPKRVKPNSYTSKEDSRTRFLCPVCEKSFRQKHLLLCHIKLHDGRPKTSSVYMSNCTTCGGNVRLTSEQARLLQERGTEDARIICSTCKILGHDVIQQQKTAPVELKPAFNFACDMCGCDIKLTDDQLQLVERKGAENIRIICAPCSMKDADPAEANSTDDDMKCNVCRRTIVNSNRDSSIRTNPTCAECVAKGEDAMAVDDINPSDDTFISNCNMCHKELFFAEQPPRGVKVVCESCKNKKLGRTVQPPENPAKPVESLAVMYKCNSCFCNMQLSAEQKELLRVRGVSGTKIICASCHAKESSKPASAKKPRLAVRTYQCDICLMDMMLDYTPDDDDDIICNTCRKAEEKEQSKSKISASAKRVSNDTKPQHIIKSIQPTIRTPINRCCTCNKTLPLSKSQIQKLKEKGGRARVKCLDCNRKTEEELRKTKKIIKTEEGVDYKCEICSISFGQRFDDFTEHFSRVHVPESDPDKTGKGLYKSKKPLMYCPICEAAFTDRANLKMHMSTHKPTELQRVTVPRKPCTLCFVNLDRTQMLKHYKDTHKIEIVKLHYTFKTAEELREWKKNQELSTSNKFLIVDPRAKVVRGRTGLVVNLRCQHSIQRKSGVKDKCPTVFCPAMMTINERPSGRYDVEYIQTHVGHGEISSLPEEDQQLVVEMLKGDSTIEEIIEELRKHYNDSTSDELLKSISGLQSLNLITIRKDLGLVGTMSSNTSDDESEGEGITDSELDESVVRYVDVPESLSWLFEPTENGPDLEESKSGHQETEGIQDVPGENYKLDLRPQNTDDDPLAAKKFEILRRLTEVLNKCTCDEHLEIVEVYLNPCEQTLNELTSGRTVEIVEEADESAPADENSMAEDTNPTLKREDSNTALPQERSKNELSNDSST